MNLFDLMPLLEGICNANHEKSTLFSQFFFPFNRKLAYNDTFKQLDAYTIHRASEFFTFRSSLLRSVIYTHTSTRRIIIRNSTFDIESTEIKQIYIDISFGVRTNYLVAYSDKMIWQIVQMGIRCYFHCFWKHNHFYAAQFQFDITFNA